MTEANDTLSKFIKSEREWLNGIIEQYPRQIPINPIAEHWGCEPASVRAAIEQDYFLTDNYLKFAFNYFDRDRSGELNLEEILRRFMQNAKNTKDPVVEKEIRSTFNEIDINHDGSISFEEFCKMMRNIIKK